MKKNKKSIIQENIIKVIKSGGVVVFPTDTVYGIGALPQKEPVAKIYKIKKRDFIKNRDGFSIIQFISAYDGEK